MEVKADNCRNPTTTALKCTATHRWSCWRGSPGPSHGQPQLPPPPRQQARPLARRLRHLEGKDRWRERAVQPALVAKSHPACCHRSCKLAARSGRMQKTQTLAAFDPAAPPACRLCSSQNSWKKHQAQRQQPTLQQLLHVHLVQLGRLQRRLGRLGPHAQRLQKWGAKPATWFVGPEAVIQLLTEWQKDAPLVLFRCITSCVPIIAPLPSDDITGPTSARSLATTRSAAICNLAAPASPLPSGPPPAA